MFALENDGARCVEGFGDIKKGAWVPKSNELYSAVEEWLESNDWVELPNGFFEVELTSEQKIAKIDEQLIAIDAKKVRPMSAILAASEGDDTSEDLAFLSELEAQAVEFRAKRAELVGE